MVFVRELGFGFVIIIIIIMYVLSQNEQIMAQF